MKKLNIFLVIIAVFLCISTVNAQTQAECSVRDFTVNTVVTASTCQSNGVITVSLSGDVAGLQQIEYSLQSSAAGGFSLPATMNPVLTGIPPGTYTVNVRAFCDVFNNISITKSRTNVVVGGTYVVPVASFVPAGRTATGTAAPTSRKSYAGCATGKIVLLLKNGTQTPTPVFTIVSAPAGVATPQNVGVTRYATGSLTAGYTYTLNGLYPAGNYTVQINDGCYTAAVSLNLGELNTIPNPKGEASTAGLSYSDIHAYIGTNSGCALINLYQITTPTVTNPDFYQYYRDSLYEIGVAPLNQMPVNWTTWYTASTATSANYVLNLSPNKISDFYGSSAKMSIYIRMKNCPSVYVKYNTYIHTPTVASTTIKYNCDNYKRRDYIETDYNGVLCYPLQYTITRTSDGAIINQKSNIMTSGAYTDTLTLNYDVQYRYTYTDNSGYQITGTWTQSRVGVSNNNTLDRAGCGYWQNYYYWSDGNCFPVYVTIKNTNGVIVAYDTIRATTDRLYNSTNNWYSPNLNYNQAYTFTFTYPNYTTANGVYTNTYTKTKSFPTSYTMSNYNVSTYGDCQINYGAIQVSTGSSSIQYPAGTIFTITGPAPFGTRTYTQASSSNIFNITNVPAPPGNYTISADYGGGCTGVYNATLPGVYDVHNFKTVKEITCNGLKVTPQGTLTLEGKSATIHYRLASGPTGYDQSPINDGGSVTLTQPGTYILGVMVSVTQTCYLKRDTIVYTAAPLALDLTKTAAYVCVGGGVGNIILQAKNGVTPYTYELWNKANTTRLLSPVSSSTRVTFNYGSKDSTYTVRVTDGCGNSFNQQITMADLETAELVFSVNNLACYGSNIQLNCLTLGETTYNWKGPNGYVSTNQYPIITNADTTNTGWYYVSVTPETCGIPVKDSIYISVYPPINMKQYADQTLNVSFCSKELIKLGTAASGGIGSFTYQWARSTNGTTYTNITGAAGTSAVFSSADAAYQFVSTTANPTYTYFRC
ncbi:MAG: hypothetical protein FWF72_02800, partial [Paludibacter sp.]|nr:hypothetical protein [Paludibacter sp.]